MRRSVREATRDDGRRSDATAWRGRTVTAAAAVAGKQKQAIKETRQAGRQTGRWAVGTQERTAARNSDKRRFEQAEETLFS